jgi:hypothetical protein
MSRGSPRAPREALAEHAGELLDASGGPDSARARPAVRRLPRPDELLLGAKARESERGRPLGPCPICGRPMVEGGSVDRHHLVPRSRGGRETVCLHRICHRKLHALWSEVELAKLFHDVETIRAHPEIRRFVAWLRNKPATFWAPTRTSRRGPLR